MTKIEKLRKIVERGQWNKVDGTRVDVFSASAIVAVHNALSPEHKVSYEAMPVAKMAVMAFKMLKK